MLHPSASAPTLALAVRSQKGTGAHAHSQRITRIVPPLALVPLDQLQQLQRRQDGKEEESQPHKELHRKVERRRRQRRTEDAGHDGKGEGEEIDTQQQRLGERFLGMMALLAKLRRMDLDESSSSPVRKVESARRSPPRSARRDAQCALQLKEEGKSSAFEVLVQKKKAERSGDVQTVTTVDGSPSSSSSSAAALAVELSPHRKREPVVNEATQPLREHLTFEISMLLPPPMDTRQSALGSPIQRKKRRRRLKKRLKRRRRPTGATLVDGKRTWLTSHATWVPHASADYAKARAEEAVAAQASSKLVAKFAALRQVTATTTMPSGEERRRHLHLRAKELGTRAARRLPEEEIGSRKGTCDEEGDGGADQESEEEEQIEEVEEGEEEDVEDALVEAEEENDDDEDEQSDDGSQEQDDTLPELLQPHASATLLPNTKPVVSQKPRPVSVIRPVQTHQAAWISPELRRWLVATGLFRTAPATQQPLASASVTAASSSSATS